MATVTLYTTTSCPYCVKAKALLKNKNATYTEVDVSNPEDRIKMMEKTAGARSVPQIFIEDNHIGGCDDLYALDDEGKLDALLSA